MYFYNINKSKKHKPSLSLLPKSLIANDKIIWIENISKQEIHTALQDFCDLYNVKTYEVLPRLIPYSSTEYAIVFPYDISFELYCYLINYLSFPEKIEKTFPALGYCTLSTQQKAMLYMSNNDTEYDNVYITTDDNKCYKNGFALGKQMQELPTIDKNYQPLKVNWDEISSKNYTDFR